MIKLNTEKACGLKINVTG